MALTIALASGMNLRLNAHRNGTRPSRSDQLFSRGARFIVDAISPGAIEASRSHIVIDGEYVPIPGEVPVHATDTEALARRRKTPLERGLRCTFSLRGLPQRHGL